METKAVDAGDRSDNNSIVLLEESSCRSVPQSVNVLVHCRHLREKAGEKVRENEGQQDSERDGKDQKMQTLKRA